MGIVEFAAVLEQKLKDGSVAADLANENAFEHGFVIPTVMEVAADFPELLIFTHRKNKDFKTTCTPNCEEAERNRDGRVIGCHKCWTRSKEWAAITVFGMRNTLDLSVRDANGQTLAIEVKWAKDSQAFQRFVGQCAIATTRHDRVLGVFGQRGFKNKRPSTKAVDVDRRADLLASLERIGVSLVVLRASEDLAMIEKTAT